jgi:hypothetical protein
VIKLVAPVEPTLQEGRRRCNGKMIWQSSEEMIEAPVKPTVQKKASVH